MDREDYDLKEEAYQQIRAEKIAEIEKKFAEIEKQNFQENQDIKTQAEKNLDHAARTYGVSDAEISNSKESLESNKKARQQFFENEKRKEIEKAEQQIEKQIFGKKWGRLESRELAKGIDDLVVKELKQQKAVEDKQNEIERKRFRPSLENPHELETLKGRYTERFNEKDRER